MTTVDTSQLFALDGRVAIVTGASSGLGHRFARVLHGAGATVIAAARRRERLDELSDTLGPRLIPVTCDVGRDEDLVDLTRRALDVAGRIDVLVNNAGVGSPGPAEDETMESWRHTMAINLDATFRLSQLVGGT